MSARLRTLAVRLDSDGDVLLAGPAVRALATDGPVDLLVSPAGEQAARLLPDVDDVLVFDAPWSGYAPPPVHAPSVTGLVDDLRRRRYDRCVVLTSFHQSPLPMALLARLAGVPFVAGTSEDYPGSLLDVRHRRPDGLHEVEAALDLVAECGSRLPADDDGRLAVVGTPDVPGLPHRYVVVHPGASVPARAPRAEHARAVVGALAAAGWDVVVTGGPDERSLGSFVAGAAPGRTLDLSGRTSFAELGSVLRDAACVVVGNTGPAHLAAAVGTPVVSLFAPVVPVERWRPWRVPHLVLGDQDAACAGTRARECPVSGHPCLSVVPCREVVDGVLALAGAPSGYPEGVPA